MTLADPPTRTLTSTPSEHLSDHQRLTVEAVRVVYSGNYATLQEALDDAKSKKRPLIIKPQAYSLTAPLLLNNASDIHIFAYGATLQASGNLAALVELRDTIRCTWSGGWLSIPDGNTVTDAFYINRAAAQSTHNHISDLVIEGHYGAGVRIGKQGSGFQCDHTYVNNLECIGRDDVGQVGIHVGDGVYGNCLNHTFHNLLLSHHETHIFVDKTNTYVSEAFLDSAVQDVYLDTTIFTLQNVRSENATRLLVTGGPASLGASITLRDILWNGQDINADGQWIQILVGGGLVLEQMRVLNAGFRPVLYAAPGGGLVIHVRGLMEGGGAVACPYAGAFNVNVNTTIKTDSYIELDSNSAVSVIT